MKTAVISVKVDEPVKQKARAVAERFGIPLSTLINAYLHELGETGQIYFNTVEVMTPEMEKEIEIAQKEIAAGEVSGPFETAEDMIKSLESARAGAKKVK